MSVWVIQCQVAYTTGTGWHGSRQVPTFNLNPDYVGYEKDPVVRLAKDIVNPLQRPDVTVSVSAELV